MESSKNTYIRGTQFDKIESIVLIDSLGKHLNYITRTKVKYFCGKKIQDLTQSVSSKDTIIDKYKCITLLIGTNNLTPKWVWDEYIAQKKRKVQKTVLPEHPTTPIPTIINLFDQLLRAIRAKNPDCTIIICSIPPRPFDHEVNKQYLVRVNAALYDFCKQHNCTFIKLYKQFTKEGNPDEKYFDDGLHFSPKGYTVLTRILNFYIGKALKK